MSRWAKKYVIGLTGSIAAGKGAVRQMLQHLGAYAIDVDRLSQQAIQPGSPAYEPMIEAFGRDIVGEDGYIKRSALAVIVAADPASLEKLESITRPVIDQAVDAMVKHAALPVIVIEASKLIGSDLAKACDAVWAVNARPEIQLQRLMETRGLSEADAKQRIIAQGSPADLLRQADVVINNNGTLEETWKQVQDAWVAREKPAPAKPEAKPRQAARSAPEVQPPAPAPSKLSPLVIEIKDWLMGTLIAREEPAPKAEPEPVGAPAPEILVEQPSPEWLMEGLKEEAKRQTAEIVPEWLGDEAAEDVQDIVDVLRAIDEEEPFPPEPPVQTAVPQPAPAYGPPPDEAPPEEVMETFSGAAEEKKAKKAAGVAPEDVMDDFGEIVAPEETGAVLQDVLEVDFSPNELLRQAESVADEGAAEQAFGGAAADAAGGEADKSKSAETAADEIEFASYYPKEIVPEVWKPLTAYMYKTAAAGLVEEDAQKQLGEAIADMRRTSKPSRRRIEAGALITATPNLPGFQFNPPSIAVGLYEDWHRFDFKLRATEAPLNQAANGFLTFTVEGVIIADVPLSIFVGESVSEAPPVSVRQKLYQAIFCSYSHDDARIVERVEYACQALGLTYMRDVMTLKSGQDWDDQLLTLIDQADIFQLFWSYTAAESPHVRMEWEHALKLGRKETNFIRPVYWEEPMPPVPPELNQIHFAFQPELDD